MERSLIREVFPPTSLGSAVMCELVEPCTRHLPYYLEGWGGGRLARALPLETPHTIPEFFLLVLTYCFFIRFYLQVQ